MFEKMLNVNLGDIYKKEEAVIKRKPTKITEFLDRLKTAIIQKRKDEGYWQAGKSENILYGLSVGYKLFIGE